MKFRSNGDLFVDTTCVGDGDENDNGDGEGVEDDLTYLFLNVPSTCPPIFVELCIVKDFRLLY